MADIIIARMARGYDYKDIDKQEDIWAGYMAAASEKENLSVKCVDYRLNPQYDRNIDLVLDEEAVLLGFALYQPTFNLHQTLSFVKELRKTEKGKNIHIILFGDSQIGVKKILTSHSIDTVLIGEEEEFVTLAKTLKEGNDWREVPGISYKNEKGKIINNTPLPLNHDLDTLPFPRRYYLDQLREEGLLGVSSKTSMLGSRGCYAKCSFCHVQAYNNYYDSYPWRGRSAKNLVEEMEYLNKEYGIHLFDFNDLNFFGPGKKSGKDRSRSFAEILIERGHDFKFSIFTRANDFDYEVLKLLKQAGLQSVFIGIESFSQPMLDRLRKGMTVKQNLEAIQVCKDLDIFIRMGFISYDRYVTLDEISENIIVLRKIYSTKPHLLIHPQFAFRPLTLLDDTPLQIEYKEKGVTTDELKYDFPNYFTIEHPLFALEDSLYDFENPLVPMLCETTRVLTFEYEAKYVQIQKWLKENLTEQKKNTSLELKRDTANMMCWMYNVPLFILDEWEENVERLGKAKDPKKEMVFYLEDMFNRFKVFNENWLGTERNSLESYEHYRKIQDQQRGVHPEFLKV